ncbi:isoleucine--tRNA ligase [Dysgonomonas sp. 521]|uniref:isoleucine--tRNA ligase n=1 Tax=Dysgonomonas sp. 521 TaxID=2302932 RepID=UPI0013D2CB05|nr:isoleucine--tRNA ligase [Dysgonomonas sp. 521]NDV93937.1 isoleucine--tRNA ligase [Dysgonomonas sp. 521]
MSKQFSEYNRFNLSDINKEILEKWDKEGIFQKSLEIRAGAPSFVFYEGPPSANGMPGIHHVMARSVKDIFCRYKTMKGYLVNRKAGWDTHGLPVELAVEKKLGITKEDIGKKITVEEYNDACRKEVMKYTGEWENLTRIMGYWVDMNDPYITYDNRYIETLWFLLKELYKKGYLYKGYTIQPYSPAAGTGLSTHELNMPGAYRDVKDTTCVAQFKIKNPKAEMSQFGEAFFLAWTTTPWTLPSNTALAVGPEITYVAVQSYNPYTGNKTTTVMAKSLVFSMFNEKAKDIALEDYKQGDKLIPYHIVGEWKGKELAGMEYEQLIPWVNPGEGAFKVVVGDFVTTEDGTGIVHIAPTFGADDAKVAKANNIPALLLLDKDENQRPMVDLTGKYFKIEDLDPEFVKNNVNIDLYKEFAGRYVKDDYAPSDSPVEGVSPSSGGVGEATSSLDIDLSVMLKQQNRAFKIERHVHNYPHCWRTDKPVLYYPLDSWFIKTTASRERMMELNKTINWKPESTGTGRFGKWLENLQDWNLSRSRYWGTPLPIWRTEDGKEEKCIGSMKELYAEMQKAVDAGVMKEIPWEGFEIGNLDKANYEKIDLHRPYVDDIILVSDSGQPMMREKDLIDVWFDSGAMPFAQVFYPNISEEEFNKVYPADFIAEGVDQTRGWFFTLHAISTMFKDSISFKNVVSNGLVLDKNGNKMSKSKGNVVNPFETIEKYGSDPLRWYMITNASPWDNLKFDIEGVEEVRRKFFGTLYNTYSFFALYANVDNFSFSEDLIPVSERPEIDRWIISLLNTLVKDVDEYYNTYEPTKAGRAISDFVNDNLSNWYVRLNRKRFWGGEMTKDKLSAYQTLYTCLETIAKLMAPISPFYADKLFCDLIVVTGREKADSVHLSEFPVYNASVVDKNLEERMQIAQDISSAVLALRRKTNIKVRQPLMQIMIPVLNEQQGKDIDAVRELILNEVNVKELKYVDNAMGILVKKVKPDFKKLGPRYGKIMKQLAAEVQAMNQEAIAAFEKDGSHTFDIDGQPATIELADVEIISEDIPGWLVANAGKLTVALDVTITDDLRKEGIARELVNRIQNIRKSSGFEITDRINIIISDREQIRDTISEYNDYIASQVLADKIELSGEVNGQNVDMDDYILQISVEKV